MQQIVTAGPDFGESGHVRIARSADNACAASFTARAPVAALPTAWDWRTLGAVTPIVNQGEVSSAVIDASLRTQHAHMCAPTEP